MLSQQRGTKDEKSRLKMALRGAGQAIGRRLDDKELADFLEIYRKVLSMDVRDIQNIPLSAAQGLGVVLARSIVEGLPLKFLSLASPAYVQDEEGNHTKIVRGEDKRSYQVIRGIEGRLRKLFPNVTYAVFLSDIDSEVAGVSQEAVEAMFAENLDGLKSCYPCANRLSEVVPKPRLEGIKGEIRTNERLNDMIDALMKRETVLDSHKISQEELRERAITYAALGRILEEDLPEAVLMDIQTRVYPYEQPFYDVLRRFPLPLIRPIKF